MATSKIQKQQFEIRSVRHTEAIPANGTAHTNLKTLIDNDIPSGKRFLAISGFESSNAYVYLSNAYYGNSDYSLEAKNTSNIERNITARIFYLCY